MKPTLWRVVWLDGESAADLHISNPLKPCEALTLMLSVVKRSKVRAAGLHATEEDRQIDPVELAIEWAVCRPDEPPPAWVIQGHWDRSGGE